MPQKEPLEKIKWSRDGDLLCELDHGHLLLTSETHHTSDTDPLPDHHIGQHFICGGLIQRFQTTATCEVLLCDRCHLRVLVLRGLQTYGKLRSYLNERFTSPNGDSERGE